MAGEALKGRQSNNPNGRGKGTKNKKTQQWEALGDFITDEGAKKFVEEIGKLDGMDYINAFAKVLSYFKPQLARTETKDTTEDKQPTIVMVSSSKEAKELNDFLNATD